MWGVDMRNLILKICFFTISFTLVFTFFIKIFIDKNIETTSSIPDNCYTVIIDAGHGGEDGGAVAYDGSLEKNFNLDIALRLQKILELYGFNVIMTRTEDKMTCDDNLKTQRQKKISDIRNRLEIINKFSNAIFVSIHQNKFSDSRQEGTQVFYSPVNLNSKKLADYIQNTVVANLQKNNKRKTKKSGTEIFLLYHSTIPAVMVECGFLSNRNDLSLLKTDDYKNQIATLVADGIINYFILR